jgi:adenylate kinase
MKIIFLGPPGSGKGTYASRICDRKGWAHISTGDLLREEISKKTELGLKANEFMKDGNLVPDELVIGMLKNRIKQEDCKDGFILDGFPRTAEQASALESIIEIETVINLVIPDEIVVQKITARRVCEKCGDLYNVADIHFGENKEFHMPPVSPKREGLCDKCGGRLMQRNDDAEEVIRERIKVYRKMTEPLIHYYTEKGLLKNVDVTGPPELMVPKILKVLDKV